VRNDAGVILDEVILPEDKAYPAKNRFFTYALMAWGAAASLFHVYIAVFGYYDTFVVVPLHVFLIGSLGLSVFDWRGRRRSSFDRSMVFDLILIVALFVVIFNPLHDPVGFELKYAAVDCFFLPWLSSGTVSSATTSPGRSAIRDSPC
jgi:hypothetical protein